MGLYGLEYETTPSTRASTAHPRARDRERERWATAHAGDVGYHAEGRAIERLRAMATKVQRIMTQPIVRVDRASTRRTTRRGRGSARDVRGVRGGGERSIERARASERILRGEWIASRRGRLTTRRSNGAQNLIFRFLQTKARIQIWMYENAETCLEGRIVGFDEYMNLVLDDAEEVTEKKSRRVAVGRILLKGDNITLMRALSEKK